MIDFIKQNYSWVFSGIGVTVLIVVYNVVKSIKKEKSSENEEFPKYMLSTSNSNTNSNTITINNMPPNTIAKMEQQNGGSPLDYAKRIINILFIDDDTKFKVVTILKKSGWVNAKMVKDIDSWDDQDVKETDIFFVDIQGVGNLLGCKDEGLGLALSLKKKYPDKKVVLYSAETKGERFHEALRMADSFLPKNAEPYEFLQIVEQFVPELMKKHNGE